MIQFIRSRRTKKPGDFAEYQPGVETILVKRGFAILVQPAPPQIPECAMVGPTETAMKPAARRKAANGRRRKKK